MTPPVSLVPRPERVELGDGSLRLPPDAGVRGPRDVAALARECLGLNGDGDEVLLELVDEPALGDEGYRLRIGPDGARAAATTPAGLRWAVQTLRQLLRDGHLPHLEILDRPRFPWRGSLLDVARWCHPLPFLYRYVDLLALHKLNVLHLHLTDDQGWRFEVERYPRLTEVGGFREGSPVGHANRATTDRVRHGGFYTQRELRDLVRYAALRGVRIMPEIDAPGHMQAAVAAYPWLGNRPWRRHHVRKEWGISSHVLNVSGEAVAFVRHVLDELMDVFPGEHVHIGGDEVPVDEWAADPAARRKAGELGLSGPEGLLGWWSGQLAAHLSAAGRRAGVWDELVEHGVPDGAVVFAWRGADRVDLSARAGHPVVAAPYEHTYLDWAESDHPDEPLAINGVLPLEEVYAYRPPGGALGLQGQLWSEYLPTPELVEWRAFPRLSAIAEAGWSPGEPDFADFGLRLRGHLDLLGREKVNFNSLKGSW